VIDPCTRDEAQVLLAAAQQHFPSGSRSCSARCRTGLRLGELRTLHWGDIDGRNRFVCVDWRRSG
jgi:integrase